MGFELFYAIEEKVEYSISDVITALKNQVTGDVAKSIGKYLATDENQREGYWQESEDLTFFSDRLPKIFGVLQDNPNVEHMSIPRDTVSKTVNYYYDLDDSSISFWTTYCLEDFNAEAWPDYSEEEKQYSDKELEPSLVYRTYLKPYIDKWRAKMKEHPSIVDIRVIIWFDW